MAKHATADEIRQKITNTIVEALKKGTAPWRQPWSFSENWGSPCNFHTKRKYTGINPLILLWTMMCQGYTSKYWGVASAWTKTLGAHVKKGEEATYIIFFRLIPKKKDGVVEKNSVGKNKMIALMREFPVFHVEQMQAPEIKTLLDGRGKFSLVKTLLGIDNRRERTKETTLEELHAIAKKYLPARAQPTESASREEVAQLIHDGIQAKLDSLCAAGPEMNTDPDFEPAEQLIKATGAKITHGGGQAYYRRPPADFIRMPNKRQFQSMTDYYQTAMHELIHWTERDERVGQREGHSHEFGELVAEIGSCFCLMEVGVPMAEKMLPKSQSYLAHWLKQMKDDPKYIFAAATQASKAVDYLLGFVGKQNPAFEPAEEESTGDTSDVGRDVA